MEGAPPRGHRDAIKPHVEPGAGQIGMKPLNKRLIVIACVGEKNGSHEDSLSPAHSQTKLLAAEYRTLQHLGRKSRSVYRLRGDGTRAIGGQTELAARGYLPNR
jgi:hypothetical protein